MDLKESLLEHISVNNAAFSKYQQRDEEELSVSQRKILAENLLNQSFPMFLNRFGKFIKKEHFKYFDTLEYGDKEKEEMIKAQIKNIIHNIENQPSITRNRRYAALQKMIKERDSYFTEDEMIRRDPDLFEEIVGQYLSSSEKNARKDFDPRSSTLVEILLNSIDQQDEEKRKQEESSRNFDESQHSEDSNSGGHQMESDGGQWGNFDNERRPKERKRKTSFISKGEREVLKDEWVGMMYNNFISGKDSEFFDYSTVDENEAFDETTENEHDCQDKYFDDEDENSKLSSKMENSQESEEDDLDIFMNKIEEHIKRQNQNAFDEEFDDDE